MYEGVSAYTSKRIEQDKEKCISRCGRLLLPLAVQYNMTYIYIHTAIPAVNMDGHLEKGQVSSFCSVRVSPNNHSLL